VFRRDLPNSHPQATRIDVRFRNFAWYGAPFLAYGYYGGGCGWLYRNAMATGDPYWWNRYYECGDYYY